MPTSLENFALSKCSSLILYPGPPVPCLGLFGSLLCGHPPCSINPWITRWKCNPSKYPFSANSRKFPAVTGIVSVNNSILMSPADVFISTYVPTIFGSNTRRFLRLPVLKIKYTTCLNSIQIVTNDCLLLGGRLYFCKLNQEVGVLYELMRFLFHQFYMLQYLHNLNPLDPTQNL